MLNLVQSACRAFQVATRRVSLRTLRHHDLASRMPRFIVRTPPTGFEANPYENSHTCLTLRQFGNAVL